VSWVERVGGEEERGVKTGRGVEEGGKSLISVEADKVDRANEGKFIHLTGKATTDETLEDQEFGVSAPRVIHLVRKVEMYQWEEKKESKKRKKLGGGEETVTVYTYSKVWSEKPINSSEFNSEGKAKKAEEAGEKVANP